MPSLAGSTEENARKIERERQNFKKRLSVAITEEDDPLAVYDQFVQWTVQTYGDNNPNSGLLELLSQATRAFMNDPIYKSDLRYLKLWTLYARQVDRPAALDIYANLLANEIGSSFSLLYEGYAALLEAGGSQKDAAVIYRQGIRRQARPLERLKQRYQEFKARNSSMPADQPRREPSVRHGSQGQSSSVSSSTLTRATIDTSGTAEDRYALMLAPPDPGKRRENYRFNLALLFTRQGGEFSIQEARARSMGLLGKKWQPPPSESPQYSVDVSSESISMPVDFNDDGSKSGGRRRSVLGGAEPTVTINTRAALDDVFGMYNSPDRTGTIPGSKFAPLKQVRLSAVGLTPRTPIANVISDEDEDDKTPKAAFRPFIDENTQPSRTPSIKVIGLKKNNLTLKTNLVPFKQFTPFVDENKTLITPRPALSVKDCSSENAAKDSSVTSSENVFSSKVFTPAQPKLAPLRDVFTEAHGKPQPKTRPLHERAKSHPDIPSASDDPIRTFSPLLDENAKTPFKVFSRPPDQAENVLTPKTPAASLSTPSTSQPAFTPFRDVTPAFTPFTDPQPEPVAQQDLQSEAAQTWSVIEVEDSVDESQEPSQYDDDDFDDDDHAEQVQYEMPLETAPDDSFEDSDSYQEIPLGGRFGRFNVMTPITERTFEFTTSTRASETPSERLGNAVTPQQRDEHGAIVVARQLADELREEEEDAEPLEPLRLSAYLPPKESPDVAIIEAKTGALSLGDSLALGSQFRPPNPCNPFDRQIITNLLSRIPSDPHFYDLRDRDSNQLDGLQKFAKKTRKSSGSGSTGLMDISAGFSLELEGHKFTVLEKLGEGGFGAVFKARDMGVGLNDESSSDDEDDEDEENSPIVALKVVKPRNIWEYHVLRRLHSALPVPLRRSIILPHALYAFRDESFLVLDFCPQGTLLNIVNNAGEAGVSQQGACLDELLVIFFTVELLRLLESMHNAGFIHGDLKIDNCLLRLEDVPGSASAWSSSYSPSGEGGWIYKGLRVIDFGRTVDTRLFPQGQQFLADWPTDDRDCFEIRENRPWTFQTDYFGLVGIIYCMLFGKYINASSIDSSSGRKKISTPLKRYWQTDLWNRLFDLLLNPSKARSDGQLLISEELGVLRGEMEVWLQANCNRASGTLKGLLKKVEVSCFTSPT